MKKNKAIAIFCLLFMLIVIFGICSYICLMNMKSNTEITLNWKETKSTRLIGILDSNENYLNISHYDTVEFVGKDYVTNTTNIKKVPGCSFEKNSIRTSTINGYTAVKKSYIDKINNNILATLDASQEITGKYYAPIDANNVDVTECDTTNGSYLGKGKIYNMDRTISVIGCIYANSVDVNISCPIDSNVISYSGVSENTTSSVTLYACKQETMKEYYAPIDANNVDVTQCDTTNDSYLGKGKIYNMDRTISVIGCAYKNTVDVNIICPNNSNIAIYSGFSKIDNSGAAIYACKIKGDKNSGTTIVGDNGSRIEYDNICESEGFKTASKIAGIIILLAKWLAPLILIIMGMIDFFKAVISSNDKAINDATGTFIKRMIIAIIIPIIPGLLHYLIEFLVGIYSTETEEEFKTCTECLKDPLNCNIEYNN